VRRGGGWVAGEDAVELVARADVELGEDLAQVVWTIGNRRPSPADELVNERSVEHGDFPVRLPGHE
jgi:hypothetical protein